MTLNPTTERRLGRMIDIAYYLLMLVAFYLFMRFAFWLVFPFLFSFFLAAVLQRPMNFARRKFKIKKSFSAIVLVLFFYLVLLAIIAVIGMRIWASARDFVSFLNAQLQNLPAVIVSIQERIGVLAQRLPDSMEYSVNNWLANFTATLIPGANGYEYINGYEAIAPNEGEGLLGNLLSFVNLEWFRAPMAGVINVAGRIPSIIIAAVITVISSFFMATGYDQIVKFVKRQLPDQRRNALSAAKRILFSSLGKLLRAYSIIMVSTAAQVAIGLLLMRLIGIYTGENLWAIVAVVAVLDFLPAVGAGFVLTPWALYSLIMGQFGLALGLILIYVVITVVHQVLEPKVMAANLGLPPVVTIASMYIGLQLFGIVGIILAPILMTLLKVLNDEGIIKLWKRSSTPAPHEAELA